LKSKGVWSIILWTQSKRENIEEKEVVRIGSKVTSKTCLRPGMNRQITQDRRNAQRLLIKFLPF
jgi:hypothetical protein